MVSRKCWKLSLISKTCKRILTGLVNVLRILVLIEVLSQWPLPYINVLLRPSWYLTLDQAYTKKQKGCINCTSRVLLVVRRCEIIYNWDIALRLDI